MELLKTLKLTRISETTETIPSYNAESSLLLV